jgi:hypothetical protein
MIASQNSWLMGYIFFKRNAMILINGKSRFLLEGTDVTDGGETKEGKGSSLPRRIKDESMDYFALPAISCACPIEYEVNLIEVALQPH